MTIEYEGVIDWPETVQVFSDGDDYSEESIAPGYRELADRTQWLRREVFRGGIDIISKVTAGAGQNFGACFVPGYDELWVVGEWIVNAQVYVSNFLGASYVRQTAIDASIVTNPSNFYGVAANALGDVIVVGSVAHFYTRERATGAWTANGWTTPGVCTRIVYLPTADRFVAVGVTSDDLTARLSGVADIFNLNNPTTQIGAAGTWTNTTAALAVDPITDRVAAAGVSDGQPRVAYSTDGGDNWTTLDGLATEIATPEWVDICHAGGNPAIGEDGNFYLAVGGLAALPGDPVGEIWRSADATTWTKVATFTTGYVRSLAGFVQHVLIGATDAGSIVVSLDDGATWERRGYVEDGTSLKVENVLGRAAFLTTTKVHVSKYLGPAEQAAIT